MAAEVFAATVAIQAALRSRKKIQLLMKNWRVCSQLRRTIREGGAMPRREACSRSAGARRTVQGQNGSASLHHH